MDVDGYRDLASSGEEFVLVDVREESEWRASHAAGAIHLSKGVLERDVEGVVADRDRILVLYCGGGYRSALSAENLERMGYRNVYSLAGGWRAWKDAGLPTEE
jgi:rhodanese-related sulfurtransferase